MSLTDEAYRRRRWRHYPQLHSLLSGLPLAPELESWSSVGYSADEELMDVFHIFKAIETNRQLITSEERDAKVRFELDQELHRHATRLRDVASCFGAMADSLAELRNEMSRS